MVKKLSSAPLFVIMAIFLIAMKAILFAFTKPKYFLSRNPKKRSKKRAGVFSKKTLIFKLKKIYRWFGDVLWKSQVFVMALGILIGKISPEIIIVIQKLSLNRLIGFVFISVFIVSFSLGFIFWDLILKDLPSPKDLVNRRIEVSTKIYDRNHELLYTIYKDKKRTPLSLDKIPPQVRLATIAAEDQQFYSHPGISIRGISRAIYKNLKEGRITGGSTITQQLVKNALLSPERTITRKLKEIALAVEVEKTFSKDKILEMYLNEVAYGGTAYGIQEAARSFFDKDAGNLTLAEAALLAGLPQSPTRFFPFGSNPESSIARQKEVLQRMEESSFITSQQKKEAEMENIVFAKNKVSIKAPHFVFFVRDELEEKYGKEVVEQGGLEVITTLDYRIQKLAETVVSSEIDKLKQLNVGNSAVVILKPGSGEILAMVGSKDYFDTKNDGNVNVATRLRQPGSSIKIVNYAFALSNGLTAATIIPDTPITFNVEGQLPYTPKNYEGGFRGNLTLRSAFAESRNIPAVKVLASYGVDKMIEMGTSMGITSWTNPKNYGLSLTLGGGEVKLIDLAQAFATISNYGKKPQITSILKVTNYQTKVLSEFKCNETNLASLSEVSAATVSADEKPSDKLSCGGEQIIDPRVAYIITDILKDNLARSPSFGVNSLLNIKDHPEVAVKTGTSNDLRDNLTIGYTKDYLVAVWIGNNDNSVMSRVASGVTGATPIFNKIMSALLSNEPSRSWIIPDGLVELPICPYTGTLACEGCPIKMEWFLIENKPEKACSSEWFKKSDGQAFPSISPFPTDVQNQYFENIFQDQMKKIKDRLKPQN